MFRLLVCVCVCEGKPDLFHVKIRRVGSWARRKQKPHSLKKTEGREEEDVEEDVINRENKQLYGVVNNQ